jgi:hypothetical protein
MDRVDDVMPRGEALGTVHELHLGSRVRELERVERCAVTAADHGDGAAVEMARPRLDLVGDVAAEGAVHGGGQELTARPHREHERPSPHPRVVELDPSVGHVGSAHTLVEAQARLEDLRRLLEPPAYRRTVGIPAGGDIPYRVRDVGHLPARACARLEHDGVEAKIEAFQRTADSRDSRADDHDVVFLARPHRDLRPAVSRTYARNAV